jgi:hypothetical protein
MPANQLIIDSINGAFGLLTMHLADLSDADLMVRPVPAANHAAWQLAHLASFDVMVADTIAPGQALGKPANLATATAKDASKSDDPAHFPKKAELLATMEAAKNITVKALAGMSDADLDEPSPESFRKFAPKVGNLLLLGPMHAGMHLGQLQVLRRKLGKPHVF